MSCTFCGLPTISLTIVIAPVRLEQDVLRSVDLYAARGVTVGTAEAVNGSCRRDDNSGTAVG